ncbi:DUF6765 family protein [Paraburkholderia phenazinium]|jgi:hypothetical protein|uniref:Uncharacterized protein n=1 Tax=Paraburkholderia phenazinium TaxID=60549 RepID=A0A1G7QAN0_9BURK|nr:DUF6765 family protein [Paraburkholderia phenazinium]SDF95647.1 hypothetical protein SAMN05216466_101686 [Paraburkholderia phenazinium]
MNIDFHYGVIYAVARVGGLPPDAAQTVAHACQYVDDATTPGILRFAGGETFERFATAHKLIDYSNTENDKNSLVWTPFHFLPAGEGQTLQEKAVCRPDSVVAREVMRRAIRQRGAENALHRLGVTLHTYVDTWAHQGFAGIECKFNRVSRLEAGDCTPENWLARLAGATGHLIEHMESALLSEDLPVGHGAALHYPDLPWAQWSYIDGTGMLVNRQNLDEFVCAAEMACRAVQAFVAGSEAFESAPGLPANVKDALRHLLRTNTSNDDQQRLEGICAAVGTGGIPGLQEMIPGYVAKGPGSWKCDATGLLSDDDRGERPRWSEAFERSDYRCFHDAVKEHRFVVTQEILPAHGLRIA